MPWSSVIVIEQYLSEGEGDIAPESKG